MTTSSFGAFLGIDEISPISDLPAVLPRGPQGISSGPTAFELDQLTWASRYNGPPNPTSFTFHKPNPPNGPDMGSGPSLNNEDTADVVQTLSNPPINKYRLLSACLMCFGNGLNDSAPGALIPYLEKHYSIGYAFVSLIFVTNAVGFISATPITDALQVRLGRAKTLVLAECIMMIAYIALVCTPPFPVVVLSFFFLGLGIAFNLALNNVFCANFVNGTTTLGFFHGSYGIGGTIGPLIATALVSRGYVWSTFYFIPLAITALNALVAYLTFRTYERDDNPSPHRLHPSLSNPQSRARSKSALLLEALRNKTTILGALFIFAYQGAEVSISGWVISFLITYRHPSAVHAGYVTAGFWAGITSGRFLLSHPAHHIGEKTAVAILTIGAAGLQILVWRVPNFIGDAVAISLVGFLLGPVYPCATAVFSRLVPRRLQMSSLAAVSALGSSGGSVAPFFTGMLAQKGGTWVLHPICVGLFVLMLLSWGGLPGIAKRRE